MKSLHPLPVLVPVFRLEFLEVARQREIGSAVGIECGQLQSHMLELEFLAHQDPVH